MAARKKILIISYYWPPAGGPGVQRWLKFAKYLPEFGWEPTVFIPENPSYPIRDESLLSEIPDGLQTIKFPIWEPYQLAEKLSSSNKKFKAGQFDIGKKQTFKSRLSIWVRGNFFIPDARVFWVKPSAHYLKKYLLENHFDAIVTTGPPHSLHLIGLALKKDFPEIRWIADFRDPWTEISYYKHLKLSKAADRKHINLEKEVFETADITLATSFTDAENFRLKGANAFCITNGFDAFKNDKNPAANGKNEKFTINYVGVLEQLRNPSILWEALAELAAEDPNFAENLKVKFVGRVDEHILNELEKSNLMPMVQQTGYLKHQEANDEMQKSDLLLITNFPSESSRGIIPGKLFEYLAAGKTILSFGPDHADVEKILKETKAGAHFNYHDKETLKQFLQQQFWSWNDGSQHSQNSDLEPYSRKKLTEKLAGLL